MTTLEEETQRILVALREQNFEDLNAALEERARLIATGALPTRDAWQMGQAALEGLAVLKQRLAAESSRLKQIRDYQGSER
jgi:hypothetical protein